MSSESLLPNQGAEHEPSSKGFRVEIEKPEEIYEQIKTPRSEWILGSTPLDEPFKEISVFVSDDGVKFTINAFLDRQDSFGPSTHIDEKTVSERFETKKVGNQLFVLGKNGKFEYGIGLEMKSPDYIFFAGIRNTPPKEIGNFESFKEELERLALITEVVVKAAYLNAGKEPPDVTLTFRPPTIIIGVTGSSVQERLGSVVRERISVEKPKIKFEMIGGQENAKQEIQSLAFALTNPELYRKWGTSPPKGILLSGPPGNGKTLLAKALASQAEARFFHVEVSDIVSKWYGEGEKLVKAVFEEAGKGRGKTIIFFDELDAIAPRRGESHEASGKIVSTLLVNIDGLEPNSNILVVAATNRPEAIDTALLRPGRFDRIVEVPQPDEEGRREILAIHESKAEELAGRKLFVDLEIEKVLEKTEGFSGADLAEIVRRVLEEKVRLEGAGESPNPVTTEDVLRTLENYERVRETKRRMGFV